ncbi:MAG: fumarate hydratase C-terminal domain-containing protein [Rhodospirillales bacterium]|jgi:L(+)-tartrate dehydratase beta subunit
MAASGKIQKVRLNAPIADSDIAALEIGQVVYLDGLIYTGREGVYNRVLAEGKAPPVDLKTLTNVNFHCSPAAAKDTDGTFRVGAVTATASFRFSKWLPRWFAETGCKVIIGKGGMSSSDYQSAFVPAGAVYLTTVGYGTGALLGRGIKKVEAAHWLDELGVAQAMWVLRVENFGPLLVESDLQGRSLFEENNAEVNGKIAKLYDGLKAPSLSRYGETDDKTKELI